MTKRRISRKVTAPKKCDPDRALAAAEVLAAVWLNESSFELEYKVDDPPVVEEDKDGNPWVTVKVQVPQLDVDMWADGEHIDQNREED